MLTDKEEIELLWLLEERQRDEARQSILEFTKYTKHDYSVNWHHDTYCQKIDDFITGKIKNLMVFMPPQHGKSEISTRRTPAMILGKNPDAKIGIVAYNHTIAAKFNKDCQRIMDTDEYRSLFDTKIGGKEHLQNSTEFEVVGKNGSLVSVGVGGGLTSRKLDIAIMDDLYKDANDAWSQVKRESVQDWYDTVLKTRLHNKSQQLLVFTRWHEEDLAGYLLRTQPDNWEVVMFEAIKQTAHQYDNREDGEALWPEQHSLETLLQIKKNNPIVFDSLYQQNPTPKEGLLLPCDELQYFTMEMIKDTKPDAIVAVCDTADEGDDNLSLPIGYVYGEDVFVVDVLFTQDPIEITQPLSALMLDKYQVDQCQFESNNGGKGFSQKVKDLKKGRTTITWKRTAQNKHTKIIMKSGQIKENFHFRSDGDDSYNKYLYELTHYAKNGKSAHDDAADATAMLADFALKTKSWGW